MATLDWSKLLGFDQMVRSATTGRTGVPAKVGAKPGVKVGAKLGAKIGGKSGVKQVR